MCSNNIHFEYWGVICRNPQIVRYPFLLSVKGTVFISFFLSVCLSFLGSYLYLWNRVAILAFHQALYSNPQHPVVVLTIASLLYHRTLEESIDFARQNTPATRIYIPEIIGDVDDLLDGEIVERVTQFVGQVKNSVDVLINRECLLGSMAGFRELPCSGLVSIFWYFNLIACHE